MWSEYPPESTWKKTKNLALRWEEKKQNEKTLEYMMATKSIEFKLLEKTIMDQVKPKEKRFFYLFIYKENRVKYFKTS